MEFQETFRDVDRKKIVELAKRSLKSEEGKVPLNYLTNERRISSDIIDKFDFGYCPLNSGHQLAGRILTPVYSAFNDLVALSTRHMERDKKNRFWHESFDKASYLYALNWAVDKIKSVNKCVVVEGEYDVAVMHSFGFNMTVGLCGSAFSMYQFGLLSRYCSNIYIMLDGDTAGRKTTQRIIKFYKDNDLGIYDLSLFPVRLPDGEDPDSFLLKNGKNAMMSILKESEKDIIRS